MAKTIRDMAIEFGWTQEEDGRGYAAFCFDKGANAVLEKVERLLNSQKFVDNPSKELFELIEQLKK